ncbi:hypothetical protein PPL_03264 [Heterostelium album PN500]|uniref:Uncharacterized protein n=1 Tax=Heterostelium pallidum (strain ATCC 26659 / Pp 5 / PN500) TaxID=670386 RepID=D3B4E1_HETP5|nr:hypothetical protein PPL_03264 [Heterostelium album PN500]EFA84189.1 hypothetical protein PPL_03264 [Heterostelium album PN500]|eukprot:XP_020436306.1 hypothetical protein PPL_03264 [Heterostelium album PN500]
MKKAETIDNVYDHNGFTYLVGQFQFYGDEPPAIRTNYIDYYTLGVSSVRISDTKLKIELQYFSAPTNTCVQTYLPSYSNIYCYLHFYGGDNSNSNSNSMSSSSSLDDLYTPPYEHKAKPEIPTVYIVLSSTSSFVSLIIAFIVIQQYRDLSQYSLISIHNDTADDEDEEDVEEPYNFRAHDEDDHNNLLEPSNYHKKYYNNKQYNLINNNVNNNNNNNNNINKKAMDDDDDDITSFI